MNVNFLESIVEQTLVNVVKSKCKGCFMNNSEHDYCYSIKRAHEDPDLVREVFNILNEQLNNYQVLLGQIMCQHIKSIVTNTPHKLRQVPLIQIPVITHLQRLNLAQHCEACAGKDFVHTGCESMNQYAKEKELAQLIRLSLNSLSKTYVSGFYRHYQRLIHKYNNEVLYLIYKSETSDKGVGTQLEALHNMKGLISAADFRLMLEKIAENSVLP